MITKDNAKRILCFGDSNTWGYIPGTKNQRYLPSERWTGILQNLLGDNYEIIEEGLNSRGIVHGDNRPGKEGRNAMEYIIPCLDTHDPLDYIVVLLGTNELKFELNQTSEDVAFEMETLIKAIIDRKSQFRNIKPEVILLSPPFIDDSKEYCKKDDKYKDATIKSKMIGKLYNDLANKYSLNFLDLAPITTVGDDGIHMIKESHKIVAESLIKFFIR